MGFINFPSALRWILTAGGTETIPVLPSGESGEERPRWLPGLGWAIYGEDLLPRRRKGRRSIQRSTRRGWNFPTNFTVGGSTQAPYKGAKSEVDLPVPALIWPGPAPALSVDTGMVGKA